ncbi:MAG: DPP IV N-terminal domain-containing protein [Porphyromonas sp.]|nr:DPP IV N-terminal domain-containing protein [Porphyromonas sp.]
MKRYIKDLFLLSLCLLIPYVAYAQRIELPHIWDGTYAPKSGGENFRSTPDGKHYTIINPERSAIVKYSYETGVEVEKIFDTETARECDFDTFDDYLISESGHHIIILRNTEPIYRRSASYTAYHYDVRRNLVAPLNITPGKVRVPLLSPDGRMCAYVIDNDIYIKKFDYDTEVRVTTDGRVNHILNGVTDWVYEEELYETSLMEWSNDGSFLAFVRTDESEVMSFEMTLFGTQNYPMTYVYKYPKAGEQNSVIEVKLYEVDNRRTITLDIKELADQEYYIPRMTFWQDQLYLFTLNRHQNHLRVFQVNPKSKVSKLWLQDEDDCYIDSNNWVRKLQFDASGIYYVSERSGRPQLYRYDHNGVMQSQLTDGQYDITNFYGVAENGDVIYAVAAPTPMDRTIVARDVRGRERLLSPESGVFSANFSVGMNYYRLQGSSATTLPRTEIRRTKDAKQIAILEDNSQLREKLARIPHAKKEFIEVRTESGLILNAWILKPLNFDPSKTYPLVMTQYSGPGSQSVMNKFEFGWEEYLSQEGFVVACVDGRGTAGRGSDFTKSIYLNMGVLESQDQIEAARALGQLPFIDAKRIGIFGWSFGGYTTLMAMTRGEGTFKAGVAVAPPVDWRLYDTIYTERYMRTPQENKRGYDATSALSYVQGLQGNLLIVQGTADDNVHAQNMMLLTTALVAADKDFQMLTYTDKNHGIYGGNTRNHLYRQITNHFKKNL